MKIISVEDDNSIVVEMQDQYKARVHTVYQAFKQGGVKNPYDKTIYNLGYHGVGKFRCVDDNGKITSLYNTWRDMIKRCYSVRFSNNNPAYYGKTEVCDEWLNLQNFGEWYTNNYYDVCEGRMHLDKDILCKDNRIYAPDKCLIVPQRINMIFMTHIRSVDSDLPAGITRGYQKDGTCRFRTQYNGKTIGTYDSLEEAKDKQLIVKRKHIREVADEYRDRIPDKLYEALLKW